MGKEDMLAVHDLSFDYDSKPTLRDIDFAVEPGMMCGLLGPNASGKSTLFKLINGILQPKRGRVFVKGVDVARLSRRAVAGLMAVVPQYASAAFSFTALQMVVMGRTSRLGALGRPSQKDYHDAEAVLDDLGVSDLKHRAFTMLSGGERQIVLLARALFQDPCILLLDEPTSHLDFKNQYLIMDMVQSMTRSRNLTSLITLHDPNLAARYCGQMVMLKQGRVHRKGMTEDVFDERALESLYGMKVSIENGPFRKCFVMPSADARTSALQ